MHCCRHATLRAPRTSAHICWPCEAPGSQPEQRADGAVAADEPAPDWGSRDDRIKASLTERRGAHECVALRVALTRSGRAAAAAYVCSMHHARALNDCSQREAAFLRRETTRTALSAPAVYAPSHRRPSQLLRVVIIKPCSQCRRRLVYLGCLVSLRRRTASVSAGAVRWCNLVAGLAIRRAAATNH